MVCCGLTLAGCSTPERRISRQPELFASYPAETQELIRQGKVGIGFDEDMVWLAVGEPDRKWTRTDAAGVSEIWAFTRFETLDGAPLYRGGYHHVHDSLYPYFEYYPTRKAHDYFRITFSNGRVTAVDVDEVGG